MANVRTILIVGAGGIGSWLASTLYHLGQHHQLPNTKITYADDDTVDLKNLPYQNFDKLDLMDTKVEAMNLKYKYEVIEARIEDAKTLLGYSCVISAVDNTAFRKLLFETAEKNPDLHWIDLRSEGRSIAIFTKHKKNTLTRMLETIPEEVKEGSCQREFELSAGIIQIGNRIIATIGAQYLLNWLRGDSSPPEFSATF